jgi:hypothetical protein
MRSRRRTSASCFTAALAVAGALQQIAEPGDRVLLLLPPGLDVIVGLLASLLAGTVCVPLPVTAHRRVSFARPGPRRRGARRPRRPRHDRSPAQPPRRRRPALAGARRAPRPPPPTPAPHSRPDDLAWLQYTSGSTGTPRGVMVRHRNAIANSSDIAAAWGLGPDSRSLMWVPPLPRRRPRPRDLAAALHRLPGHADVAARLHPATRPLVAADRRAASDPRRRPQLRLRGVPAQARARRARGPRPVLMDSRLQRRRAGAGRDLAPLPRHLRRLRPALERPASRLRHGRDDPVGDDQRARRRPRDRHPRRPGAARPGPGEARRDPPPAPSTASARAASSPRAAW